jgi:hypothetical protein
VAVITWEPLLAAPATANQQSAKATIALPAVDVAGIRLGMSLNDARAAVKARNLAKSREWSADLTFHDELSGKEIAVPNGHYVNAIAAWTSIPMPPTTSQEYTYPYGEHLIVWFTPVPGEERVVQISYHVGYPYQKSISRSSFEDALAKKYAEFKRTRSSVVLTWMTGPGGLTEATGICLGGGAQSLAAPDESPVYLRGDMNYRSDTVMNIAVSLAPNLQVLPNIIRNCGPMILRAGALVPNSRDPPEAQVVQSYNVVSYSPKIVLEDIPKVQGIVQHAESAAQQEHKDQARDQAAPKL